jgi:hypothetical protein
MKGRAFVSGVESPQAVKPQRQSPAISSLGLIEGRKQPNGNGNGYYHLQGEWLTYYKVALPFASSVPDREDLLHTIIANLADAGRNNGHKPDNAFR